MTVHVDNMTTEVIPEVEPPQSVGGGQETWEELAHVRQSFSRLVRDEWRTAAEGFDD